MPREGAQVCARGSARAVTTARERSAVRGARATRVCMYPPVQRIVSTFVQARVASVCTKYVRGHVARFR